MVPIKNKNDALLKYFSKTTNVLLVCDWGGGYTEKYLSH